MMDSQDPSLYLHGQALHAYIQFVHPQIPVLDLDHLIGLYHSATQLGLKWYEISVLYTAVIAAGALFLGATDLERCGFSRREDIVSSIVLKLENLMEQKPRKTSTRTCHTLLLLSFITGTISPETTSCRIWLLEAISELRLLQANDLMNPNQPPMGQAKCLRKRLWWSCYLWARIQSSRTKLPAIVTYASIPEDPITSDDFQPIGAVNTHQNTYALPSWEENAALANRFVDNIRTCFHMENIDRLLSQIERDYRSSQGVSPGSTSSTMAGIESPFSPDSSPIEDVFRRIQDLEEELKQIEDQRREGCLALAENRMVYASVGFYLCWSRFFSVSALSSFYRRCTLILGKRWYHQENPALAPACFAREIQHSIQVINTISRLQAPRLLDRELLRDPVVLQALREAYLALRSSMKYGPLDERIVRYRRLAMNMCIQLFVEAKSHLPVADPIHFAQQSNPLPVNHPVYPTNEMEYDDSEEDEELDTNYITIHNDNNYVMDETCNDLFYIEGHVYNSGP